MSETHGLRHIALAVADLDRALASCRDVSGVRDPDSCEIEPWFESTWLPA